MKAIGSRDFEVIFFYIFFIIIIYIYRNAYWRDSKIAATCSQLKSTSNSVINFSKRLVCRDKSVESGAKSQRRHIGSVWGRRRARADRESKWTRILAEAHRVNNHRKSRSDFITFFLVLAPSKCITCQLMTCRSYFCPTNWLLGFHVRFFFMYLV